VYDNRRRAGTREAIVEVARDLFLRGGYAATTISATAEAADVSVETIYKGFGRKPGLVRAILAKGLEGEGPVPAERPSDEMQATARDPYRVPRNWGAFVTEISRRVAPILLLARDTAATDPEIASLLEEMDQATLRRKEHNARTLYERGDLRPDVTLELARDVLWMYSSTELYELMVVRRGWDVERYGRFVAEGMIAALLPTR
jgi:AcrR family transcriptional regulator